VISRNLNTKEIYPVCIELTNIRKRCTTLQQRKWNLIFGIGEFAWHARGSNRLKDIEYYSRNWVNVSENGLTIRESCYGNKIFGESQNWQKLLDELRNDRGSRRAVINLYDSRNTLGQNLNDVACTLSLQFLIRNNKLDLVVTMRSNDIIWGLPNDIFFFTILQEYLALILGVEPGKYYHQVASMHIYSRHFFLMDKILSNPTFIDFTMPHMGHPEVLTTFLENEMMIRKGQDLDAKGSGSAYWDEFISLLKLRSRHLSVIAKNEIINNSEYKEVLELCSPSYIFDNSVVDSSALS
jgi:thymidylate synthase